MRNGNRRPVSLVRRGEEGSGKLLESGLGQHVSVFLECERQRLRSLDKATAKKIIGNAERNLMHFMKSKAKVNCFRSPSRQTSYNNTATLFDPKQLKAYLQHEQRKHKHPPPENAPLIDSSLRQLQQNKPPHRNKLRCSTADYTSYTSLSSQRRTRRMLYY